MDQNKLELVVSQAVDDLARGDTRRAKDRLRSVILLQPHHKDALSALGHAYYDHGDFRNAALYWSQGEIWEEDACTAYRKVLSSAIRALNNRNLRLASHYLDAFASTKIPDDLRECLSALIEAYHALARMEAKRTVRSCGPQCGVIMVILIGISTLAFGLGWSWFIWIGGLAVVATVLVSAGNALSHFMASIRFQRAIRRAVEIIN